MKVRFSIPVRGTLGLSETGAVQFPDWEFRFEECEHSGFVVKLIVEISNVDPDKWPALSEVADWRDRNVFPFQPNQKALQFSDFEEEFRNIESYLGLFGLEEMSFESVETEWIPHESENTTGLMSGWKEIYEQDSETAEPLSDFRLALFIGMAAEANTDTALSFALASLRVARMNFRKRLFIEAFRHAYFCLEALCSNSLNTKKVKVEHLVGNTYVAEAIRKNLLSDIDPMKEYQELVRSKLGPAPTLKETCRYFYDTRNQLQHARAGAKFWHPSKQYAFEKHACCLMTIADHAAYAMLMDLIASSSLLTREPKPG